MKAVLQRVSRAAVRVEGETVGEISRGLVILLGVFRGDTETDAGRLAERSARLRIFGDEAGRMNLSLLDTAGQALVVSQFTLAGRTDRGLRPSFEEAAPAAVAEDLYEKFAEHLSRAGVRVATGRFGARMDVELVGDGPVTIVLDEPRRRSPG